MAKDNLVRRALRWKGQHPRAYNAGRVLLGFVVSGVLGWLAVTGMDWSRVAWVFRAFPLTVGALALGLFLVSNLVRAYRWQLLFVEERVSLLRLFVVQNAGIGLNNLMPVRMFSETTQFALLTLRRQVSPGAALATLGVERVLDLAASTLLLAVGLVLLPQLGGLVGFGPQMAFAVVLSLGGLGAMRLLAWGSRRWRSFQRVPLIMDLGLALTKLERHWTRLTASFLLTLLYWVLLGLCAWVIGQGLGLTLSVSAAVVIVVVVTFFATSVPSVPGAIGTFEFAAIYMLRFFGVDREQALPFALGVHLLFYLPPVLFTLVVLPLEGLPLWRSRPSAPSKEPTAPGAGPGVRR